MPPRAVSDMAGSAPWCRDLLDPGIVMAHRRRPEVRVPHGAYAAPGTDAPDAEISPWGVAVKP